MRLKALALLFTSLLLVTTACGSGDPGGSKEVGKADGTKEGTTVLKLSIAQSDSFIDIVKKKFEEKFPDIKLEVQSYRTGEEWTEGEFEKYQKTVNTALLSANGPDLIEVGMLPIDDFAEKKVLVNLSPYMEKGNLLDIDQLQSNALEGLKINGSLFAMTPGFYLTAFIGDQQLLDQTDFDDKSWDWKKFGTVAETLKNETQSSGQESRYALGNLPPSYFLNDMVRNNYTAFVDHDAKQAKFDTAPFIATMEEVKQMYDDGMIVEELPEGSETVFQSTGFYSFQDVVEIPFASYEAPQLLYRPHAAGQNGEMKISPGFQFAVRETSEVKEDAIKFIAFLLSEEVQNLPEREGFSMLKSVNEQKINQLQEEAQSGNLKLSDGRSVTVDKAYLAKFQEMLNSADYYPEMDGKILNMIMEESETYFSGKKSAAETAKMIQNRVMTYLNE